MLMQAQKQIDRRSRSSFQVMRDVVAALFVREMKTRFGSTRLGYLWALVEPVGMVLVLVLIFTLVGRASISGADLPVFLLTGILPFTAFRTLFSKLSGAVKANKALFIYRQLSPIDPIIARLIIEIVFYVLAFVILLIILSYAGYDCMPDDFLSFFAMNIVLITLGVGIGLCLCVANEYWKDVNKVITLLSRPLFFMSGLFYVMSMVPRQYWYIFAWNPVLHLIELGRSAFFSSYTTEFANWLYPSLCSLSFLALGLALYRVNRYKLIASS